MGFKDFMKKLAGAAGVGTTCPNCGGQIGGASYQFREVRRYVPNGSTNMKFDVRFDYVCPKCGKSNTFTKGFTPINGENLQTKVEVWAERHFRVKKENEPDEPEEEE